MEGKFITSSIDSAHHYRNDGIAYWRFGADSPPVIWLGMADKLRFGRAAPQADEVHGCRHSGRALGSGSPSSLVRYRNAPPARRN